MAPKLRWVGMHVKNTMDESTQDEVPVLNVKLPGVPEVEDFVAHINRAIMNRKSSDKSIGPMLHPLTFHSGARRSWKVKAAVFQTNPGKELASYTGETWPRVDSAHVR